MITLSCWVYGEPVDNVFEVEVPPTKSVAYLKKAIKNENPISFSNVDTKDLKLYAIPNPEDAVLEETLNTFNLRDEKYQYLNARRSVLDCVDKFIIVRAPTPAKPFLVRASVAVPGLTLNCWVRGHGANNIFPVEISTAKSVAALKKVIKSEKPIELHDHDANTLALYKVSIPYDSVIEDALKHLTLDHAMLLAPLVTLSHVFSEAPLENHVHVVVETPPSTRFRMYTPSSAPSLQLHTIAAQRDRFLQNNPKVAPSSGGCPTAFAAHQRDGKQTIYCGRPHTACAPIPATLRHPAFGEFVDDCNSHDTTAEDNSFAERLRIAMSDMYAYENDRATAIRTIFGEWGLPFNITLTGDRYPTDGDMSVNGHHYVITEFKNEVGGTVADPYNQACLYYLEATREHAKSKWYSPLPCMILLLFGPYLAFAGARWDTCPVVQPFSILQMHYHPTDTLMQLKVARHLRAFKRAVRKLSDYYLSPDFTDVIPFASRTLFPHYISFMSLQDNTQRQFAYDSHPFPDRLLFFGTLGGQHKICIKFVRQYSKETHQMCASLGYAPMLLGFEKLSGDWFMVVMDRLDEEWECPAYAPLSDRITLTASHIDALRNGLTQLHQASLVHGDVRDANLMVSKSDATKIMLVDFDWGGAIGEVRYPMNVNRGPELWRPEGAVDGALILPNHDMEMLDQIERQYCVC